VSSSCWAWADVIPAELTMPTGAVRHGVDAVDGGFGSVDDGGDPVDGGCRIPDDLCCRADHCGMRVSSSSTALSRFAIRIGSTITSVAVSTVQRAAERTVPKRPREGGIASVIC